MTEEAEEKKISDLEKLKRIITNKELMTKLFFVLIITGIVLVYVSRMMLDNGAVETATTIKSLGEMFMAVAVLVIAGVILFSIDDKMPKPKPKEEEETETTIETDQTIETKEAPE